MTLLGRLKIKDFLQSTNGKVRGELVTDAKYRIYSSDYKWREDSSGYLWVSRKDGRGDEVKIKSVINLDEDIVSFFGLYSGDGAKGSEDPKQPGTIKPVISFSQREPNLVSFAVDQFRRLFPGSIHFVFSLGEDSAYFMDENGLNLLKNHYGVKLPEVPPLSKIRPKLNSADERYLSEKRPIAGDNESYLAFYYFHKTAMQEILTEVKRQDIEKTKISLNSDDRITASLRRPFKKGAREPGGTSRSDEMHVGGLNGIGELFLKFLHEVEDSIERDSKLSTQGLVEWVDKPSMVGQQIDVCNFFSNNVFGQIGGERPTIEKAGLMLKGKWPRSKEVFVFPKIRLTPMWCYISGLYLAEGSTKKSTLFSMVKQRPSGLSFGFTSSENTSLNLMIRTLQSLFPKDDCVTAWKVKVGSQYFPELSVIGLKNSVPMLRGGNSGDGKMRTMEISLSIKDWALGVAPCLKQYADKYSHVEPTGAGVARIDFWASSALTRWYFPLLMYSVFGNQVKDPSEEFLNE